jgi:N4-gp56 family major capsid protein
MATFKVSTANEKNVWSTNYTQEYVRQSGFMPYMGTSSNAIIRVDKQLSSQNGAVIHFPYFTKLSGAGVTGGTTLYGSEDTLSNFSTAVRATLRRNAVAIPESETFRTELDIANVARDSLKNWSAESLRNDFIAALNSMVIAGGTDGNGGQLEDTYISYASASAGQRNAHLVANADRTLFGNLTANGVSGVMATALATVTSAQTLSAKVLNMAKTLAKKSNPYKINPYRSDATAGREYYVLFVGPEGFRDLQNDATIYAANKDARERDLEKNPIFQSGDMVYNGLILREITEMPLIGNVGASSASIGQAYLCGTGALALAYSKMPEARIEQFDYQHVNGVGIVEIRGQAKMSAAGTQTGCVTLFHAASPDA